MASDIDLLVSMGFSRVKAEKAWKAIKGAGLQPALDWLLAHPEVTDEPDNEADSSHTVGNDSQTLGAPPQDSDSSSIQEGEVRPQQETAQSLVCDDCGKTFRDANSAQLHAARSSHQNFSESTKKIKPLTEEEKKAKLAELKARLAEKRAAQAQNDLENRKEQERIRRKAGQDISEARARLEEKELKQAAAAKRREKEEERIARAKIKAQIEQDKRERAARREAAKNRLQNEAAPQTGQVTVPPTAASQTKRTYNEARLQIRVPGASPITQTFPAEATLADVYQHIHSSGITSSFALSTTFPKRTFDENDKNKSLQELNLVPSSALNLAYI